MHCQSSMIIWHQLLAILTVFFLLAIAVFFHFLVHGHWSSWSLWPNCNKPCNGGNRTRKRQCDNPEPAFGGRNCEGPITESEPCNVERCPGMHLFDEVEYNFIRKPRF